MLSLTFIQEALTLKEQVRGRGGATDISIDANAPYLDQLYTWAQGLQVELSWEYIRTRLPGRPTWKAMPIVQTVRLTAFVGSGTTEAAAQASAAEKLIVFGVLNDISE
ncbi:hypothetical protein FS749_016540 [Ceratobasidium sp. UAMH 11750]|nr:hypothetical protein FS749_016540 [Ceratobasidium sp. UAMH 11750]